MRRGTVDPDGLRHVQVDTLRRPARGSNVEAFSRTELERMLTKSKKKREKLANNADFAALLQNMEAAKRKEKVEDAFRQVMAPDPTLPTSQELADTSHERVSGVFSMRGQPYVPLGGDIFLQLGPKPDVSNNPPPSTCRGPLTKEAIQRMRLNEPDNVSLAPSERTSISSAKPAANTAKRTPSEATNTVPADSSINSQGNSTAQRLPHSSKRRTQLNLAPSTEVHTFPREEVQRGTLRKQQVHIGKQGFGELLRSSDEVAYNLKLLANNQTKNESVLRPAEPLPASKGIPRVMQNTAERMVAELYDEFSDDEETAFETEIKSNIRAARAQQHGNYAPRPPDQPPGDAPRTSNPRRLRRSSFMRAQTFLAAQKRVDYVAKLEHKMQSLERSLYAAYESRKKANKSTPRHRLPLRSGRAIRGTQVRATTILQAHLALQAKEIDERTKLQHNPTEPYDTLTSENLMRQVNEFRTKRDNLQRELRYELLRRHLARFHAIETDQQYVTTTQKVIRRVERHLDAKPRRGRSHRRSPSPDQLASFKSDTKSERPNHLSLVSNGLEDLTSSMSIRKRALALTTGASLELSWKLHQSFNEKQGKSPLLITTPSHGRPSPIVKSIRRGPWHVSKRSLPVRGSIYEMALFYAAEFAQNPADVEDELQILLDHIHVALGDRTDPLREKELRAVLRTAPTPCVHHGGCKKLINYLAEAFASDTAPSPQFPSTSSSA